MAESLLIARRYYVWFMLGLLPLLLVLVGCEVPTELSLGGGGRNSVQPPHSVFAAAYKFVPVRQAALEDGELEMRKEYVHLPTQPTFQVAVGHPLHIETYHLSRSSKFGRVDIWVNGQLVRSEQSGGPAAFPDYLGEMQVLGWPDGVASPEFILFPSSNCERVGEKGVARRLNPIELKYPSSTWSLCHTWVGLTPGAYELKMQATDGDGVKGEPVVQRIEIFEVK
jgi:hypothetical protein